MQKRSVSFVGIGGQSSGSDFLYTYLHAHPETCIPTKATDFFSDARRYARGIAWYEDRFSKCRSGRKKGECSSHYLGNKAAAERIAQSYPQAKLLAVVCNPLERLYHEYQRAIKVGTITEKVSLARYIELHPESLTRGLFGAQLEVYFGLYSPLQLYVAVHEDRYDDPIAYVQNVYRFLEIDESFVPKELRPFVTIDPDNPPPKPLWWRIIRVFLAPLRWVRLDRVAYFIIKMLRPYVLKVLRQAGLLSSKDQPNKKPAADDVPIPESLRSVLHEYYLGDVRILSRILKRDLVHEWGMSLEADS